MQSKRRSEIKVGMTVFVGTLLFVWLVIWVKDISIFADNRQIGIEFSSVPGLELGDPVAINGVRSGKVKNIKLNDNSVRVTIEIPKEIHLHSDATFSLLMLDMMGGKKISISQGTTKSELNYSSIQLGYFPGDISTAIAALSSVQTDLVTMVKDAKITLGLVNDLMSGGDIKREMILSLKGLNKLTENITSVIDENKKSFKSLIYNGNNLTKTVNETVQENKLQIPILFKRMNELVTESKLFISSANAVLDETKSSKNNLGKMLYDKDVYSKLIATLNQLQELTKIFTEQLKKDGLNVDAHIF